MEAPLEWQVLEALPPPAVMTFEAYVQFTTLVSSLSPVPKPINLFTGAHWKL